MSEIRRRSMSVLNSSKISDMEQYCATERSPANGIRGQKKLQPIIIQPQQINNPFIQTPMNRIDDANVWEAFQNGNTVIKEGWLYNKSRIFVQLCRSKIKEWADDKELKLLRVLSLEELSFNVVQDKQYIKINFSININVVYQAKDVQEAKTWCSYIQAIKTKFSDKSYQNIQPKEVQRYFGNDLITESDLLNIVETGDLLLFETNNNGAAIQRALCKSQYDHVAIAVKVAKKYVFVFDSNADTGVTFMEWNQFIEVNDLYERVAIRRLVDVDRLIFERKLLQFIQQVHGKKYEVTFSKLFRARSLSPKKDCYFCSELVAKAFKEIGLLEDVKASSSYWPVSFTKSINLTHGRLLDPITVILKKHLQ